MNFNNIANIVGKLLIIYEYINHYVYVYCIIFKYLVTLYLYIINLLFYIYKKELKLIAINFPENVHFKNAPKYALILFVFFTFFVNLNK